VLAEDASDWFDVNCQSPYMLMVANVTTSQRLNGSDTTDTLQGLDKLGVLRTTIPAVTHVNYSARVHTVSKETNPRFHALLSSFKQETGCPVLVNTSFNVRGEPIVNSPKEAYRCFVGTGLDLFVIGNFMLLKSEQKTKADNNYANNFDPD
jgi:carbamoyltransferase